MGLRDFLRAYKTFHWYIIVSIRMQALVMRWNDY